MTEWETARWWDLRAKEFDYALKLMEREFQGSERLAFLALTADGFIAGAITTQVMSDAASGVSSALVLALSAVAIGFVGVLLAGMVPGHVANEYMARIYREAEAGKPEAGAQMRAPLSLYAAPSVSIISVLVAVGALVEHLTN